MVEPDVVVALTTHRRDVPLSAVRIRYVAPFPSTFCDPERSHVMLNAGLLVQVPAVQVTRRPTEGEPLMLGRTRLTANGRRTREVK